MCEHLAAEKEVSCNFGRMCNFVVSGLVNSKSYDKNYNHVGGFNQRVILSSLYNLAHNSKTCFFSITCEKGSAIFGFNLFHSIIFEEKYLL